MDRLSTMEVLVRVVENGSFSDAARQLRVGQPAVSKTIARLEERLGVSLLLRSSRRLAPTEAGQNFYQRAKRSIEEAEEAELAARDAGAGLAGRLRFSSGVTFGRLHIIPRLPLFLAVHPELTVEAVLDDRDVDLIEEGIDVAFPMGVLADSTMVARKIGQSRRLVLGTPSYFKKSGEPSAPAELADHQAVIFDLCPMKGRSTWLFRSGTAEETVTLKGSMRTTAAEGLREAVFAGLGLCVASEWMFQPDLDNGRVKQVLPAWTLPAMDLWAAFPTGRRASAKARAFAAFIEDQLRQTNFAEQPARRAELVSSVGRTRNVMAPTGLAGHRAHWRGGGDVSGHRRDLLLQPDAIDEVPRVGNDQQTGEEAQEALKAAPCRVTESEQRF